LDEGKNGKNSQPVIVINKTSSYCSDLLKKDLFSNKFPISYNDNEEIQESKIQSKDLALASLVVKKIGSRNFESNSKISSLSPIVLLDNRLV